MLAMSPPEVGARLSRTAGHRLDDAAWRLFRERWRRAWEPEEATILRAPPLEEPLGFLTSARADGLRRRDPAGAAALVAVAEAALGGRARFFGYPELELGEPVDYSRDALTGRRWPDRHGKLLDYRNANAGDPKWIWELNRCQAFPLLVQAWLLTGEGRFADAAVTRLRAWVEQSVPGRGIAWSNGFEAGIRALSLATCFDGLRPFPRFEEESARLVLRSLWQHGRWILRDPATHSSANNHRIGELAGLAAIGLLAPELSNADRWTAHALEGLSLEAERQIAPDGTGVEQAFSYHLFVVDLFLVVVALLDARRRDVPAALLSALSRSAAALASQLGESDPPPAYGDADDGRALRLDGLDLREPRGLLASLAARLGHGGARRASRSLDPTAWWLFGEAGAARFEETEAEDLSGSVLLADAGLVVLRRERQRVTVDGGPLGYLSLAAHGHADALQVTLADEGEDLIVDPGVGSYFGRLDWRRAFRSTRFHATVAVDGLDQSEAGGSFLWRRHARATVLLADLDAGLVVAEHEGYQRLPDPVRHRRAVALMPDGAVLVCDRLEAREAHRCEQVWPFHPALEAREAAPRVLHVSKDGLPRLLVVLAASAVAALELERGREQPLAGWWSSRLESAVPSWVALFTTEVVGGVALAALLRPAAGSWPTAALAVELVGERTRATVTGPGIEHALEFGLAGDGSPRLVTTSAARVGSAR
jgi:hypothetical protein